PVEEYLTLGPLGAALMAQSRPRALLIDEIDKSDLDFANDLLNVIEDGEYDIPELQRLGGRPLVTVKDASGRSVQIEKGRLMSQQFPFVVMTSNGEREFPAPFLRRCVRLTIDPPTKDELTAIVDAHLEKFISKEKREDMTALIDKFLEDRQQS